MSEMDPGRNRLLQLLTIVGLLVIADQVSKAMVRVALAPGASVPVIDGILRITHVQNYEGFSWWVPTLPLWVVWVFRLVLVIIVLVAFPVHTFYTQTRRSSIWADLAVVGITASGCGHLLDDLFAQYTTDFIQAFHSPSANLADVFAYIGIGGLAMETLLMLRIRQPKWRGFRHLLIAAVRTRNEFLQYVRRAIGFRCGNGQCD